MVNKKTILIGIYLIILIAVYFINPAIFIILFVITIPIVILIIPLLYYVQLMKQPMSSDEYYIKFVQENHIHLNEDLLVKMFDARINTKRNFYFSYLVLFGAFLFAILNNREYFRQIWYVYEFFNLYYYYLGLGLIGICVVVYDTFKFDRYTLEELKMLFKATEELKRVKE